MQTDSAEKVTCYETVSAVREETYWGEIRTPDEFWVRTAEPGKPFDIVIALKVHSEFRPLRNVSWNVPRNRQNRIIHVPDKQNRERRVCYERTCMRV